MNIREYAQSMANARPGPVSLTTAFDPETMDELPDGSVVPNNGTRWLLDFDGIEIEIETDAGGEIESIKPWEFHVEGEPIPARMVIAMFGLLFATIETLTDVRTHTPSNASRESAPETRRKAARDAFPVASGA